MKVLITGAAGQLGWELQRSAPSGDEIVAVDYEQLDITDAETVASFVSKLRPDVIINAAAYTAVDRAESEIEVAFQVNAEGAGNLAEAAKAVNARLVQISTDFIFDGRQSIPYRVTDSANPLSVYGDSKLEGEKRVLEVLAEDCTIIRTAWVYSCHGANFVKTMLRLMTDREQLSVIADQVGSPTWAKGLADVVWCAIAQDAKGIFHWTDAGIASWYDFAVAIQEEGLALGLLAREIPLHPIRTSDYPTAAERPAFSIMDKQTTWQALALQSKHWRVALREMLAEIADNSEVTISS